mmetsp:Transcript_13367/g.22748  ORF Transcript_13367/g.22748 Transcript_13367/m.22748 type:complete len:442 (-) Transcript_13367:174-1499(-)
MEEREEVVEVGLDLIERNLLLVSLLALRQVDLFEQKSLQVVEVGGLLAVERDVARDDAGLLCRYACPVVLFLVALSMALVQVDLGDKLLEVVHVEGVGGVAIGIGLKTFLGVRQSLIVRIRREVPSILKQVQAVAAEVVGLVDLGLVEVGDGGVRLIHQPGPRGLRAQPSSPVLVKNLLCTEPVGFPDCLLGHFDPLPAGQGHLVISVAPHQGLDFVCVLHPDLLLLNAKLKELPLPHLSEREAGSLPHFGHAVFDELQLGRGTFEEEGGFLGQGGWLLGRGGEVELEESLRVLAEASGVCSYGLELAGGELGGLDEDVLLVLPKVVGVVGGLDHLEGIHALVELELALAAVPDPLERGVVGEVVVELAHQLLLLVRVRVEGHALLERVVGAEEQVGQGLAELVLLDGVAPLESGGALGQTLVEGVDAQVALVEGVHLLQL